MKKLITIKRVLVGTGFIFLLFACNKKDFLDAKPSTSLTVPETLPDFQALLDNFEIINQTPGLGDMSADNYFYADQDYATLFNISQNCYIWAQDIFDGVGGNLDWGNSYQAVYAANVVLDGLANINRTTVDSNTYDELKGSALFIRANSFFNLAQVFAPVYDSTTSDTDPGIPIRLHSEVNSISQRASLKDTYSQILSDLSQATALIHTSYPNTNINRPIKPAAFALLSRVCLSMGAYHEAGLYADSSLQLYNTLIDYNTLNISSRIPFTRFNSETMFQAYQVSIYTLAGSHGVAQVDSLLYESYLPNDLRKQIFYRQTSLGLVILKGTYSGNYSLFNGFATNEMYLNRAESFAREGSTDAAMTDLNTLLNARFIQGTFTPLAATDSQDALNQILTERRKELPFTGVRWTDLRRLNREGANIILHRLLNGQIYTLPPASNLYTLPIPPDEIQLSGIAQNPR